MCSIQNNNPTGCSASPGAMLPDVGCPALVEQGECWPNQQPCGVSESEMLASVQNLGVAFSQNAWAAAQQEGCLGCPDRYPKWPAKAVRPRLDYPDYDIVGGDPDFAIDETPFLQRYSNPPKISGDTGSCKPSDFLPSWPSPPSQLAASEPGMARPIAAGEGDLSAWPTEARPASDTNFYVMADEEPGASNGAANNVAHSAKHSAASGVARGVARGAANGAPNGAVHGAPNGAVHGALNGAVHGAPNGAVHGALNGAVHGAPNGAVHGVANDAVHGVPNDAVHGVARGAYSSVSNSYLADKSRAAHENTARLPNRIFKNLSDLPSVFTCIGNGVRGIVYDLENWHLLEPVSFLEKMRYVFIRDNRGLLLVYLGLIAMAIALVLYFIFRSPAPHRSQVFYKPARLV